MLKNEHRCPFGGEHGPLLNRHLSITSLEINVPYRHCLSDHTLCHPLPSFLANLWFLSMYFWKTPKWRQNWSFNPCPIQGGKKEKKKKAVKSFFLGTRCLFVHWCIILSLVTSFSETWCYDREAPSNSLTSAVVKRNILSFITVTCTVLPR